MLDHVARRRRFKNLGHALVALLRIAAERGLDRPIFAGVISVAIFLAGLIAMTRLPISEYPEVVPPSVQVTAQ
ncbi:MAG: efflux RND transporter permease subunit, partial [Xanthobacteraceae bacterium]